MLGKCLFQHEIARTGRGGGPPQALAQNTIDVYRLWIRQFLSFSAQQHGAWKPPGQLGTADVEAFLNDLVIRRRLSASAQNQARVRLVFLYEQVMADVIPQDHLGKFLLQRSRRPQRLPTVLSSDEVRRIIEAIDPARMSRAKQRGRTSISLRGSMSPH